MNRFIALALLSGVAACASAAHISGIPPVGNRALFSEKNVSESPFGAYLLADTIPPVITCPPNITLNLPPNVCDTIYEYDVTAEDDQPGVIVAKVYGIASGEVFPDGVTTSLYLAVDAAGNTASCSFSVTVVPDQGPPTITCKNALTISLGANCTRILVAGDMLEPPFGCNSAYIVEADVSAPYGNGPWVPAVFGPSDLKKTHQVRVTVKKNGNKCWSNVTIVDSLPPSLLCPEINVPCTLPLAHLAPTFLKDSLGITGGNPIIMEGCAGTTTMFFTDVSTNLPCDSPGNVTGYIRRFWTVLDAANNAATCVQRINRTRDLKDALFPPDITISCAEVPSEPGFTGGPYTQVGNRKYSLLTAPFCEIDAFYEDTYSSACGGGTRIRREWMVRDACQPNSAENPIFGVQYIDVIDQKKPVLLCPKDTVVLAPGQNCLGTMDVPDIVARDNCSYIQQIEVFWVQYDTQQTMVAQMKDFAGNDPTIPDTLAVFDAIKDYPIGTSTIQYLATDACGNTASCEVTLHVWDGTPPKAGCDSLVKIFLDATGHALLSAASLDGNSSDDCNFLYFKVLRNTGGLCDPNGGLFTDNLAFCCEDKGDTIPVVLRVYDVEVPAGIVSDTFGGDQYADCHLKVEVLDTNPTKCILPPDVTVGCDTFDATMTSYGDVQHTCDVNSLETSANYAQFDTSCQRGVIIRTFRVVDTNTGNSAQCSQKITVENTGSSYYVHFPDDVIVTKCEPSGLYGEPTFFKNKCVNIGMEYQDEIFTVVPDACLKIERTWTIINWCTFDANLGITTVPNPNPNATVNHPDNLEGPVVSAPGTSAPWTSTEVKINPTDADSTDYSTFWSADANAYQYKQIIKIIDTESPEILDCPNGMLDVPDMTTNDTMLWNEPSWFNPSTGGNDLCENPLELSITAKDACAGENLMFQYLLFLDLDNNGSMETVVNSVTTGSTGLGWNAVRYGNANTPNYSGGTVRHFDKRPVGADQKYGFAIEVVNLGDQMQAFVRWNTQADPDVYTDPQLPHGKHQIRWNVADNCGNDQVCIYDFVISEGMPGLCVPPEINITGEIHNANNAGINNIAVTLDGEHSDQQPFTLYDLTDQSGAFDFVVRSGDSYAITPFRNDDPLNGVSTFDLLLINKHILGLESLNSPFKIIAADANNSRSVTTFDIVELRRLILGIYTEFPANTSWRFVDADYVFPNPASPFEEVFPEMITQLNLPPSPTGPHYEFVGVKVGDTNGNADPGAQTPAPDDRAALPLLLNDALLHPGETLRLPLCWGQKGALAGTQFALEFDPEVLEIQTLEAGSLPGARGTLEEYYAQPRPGLLTFSWDDIQAPSFAAGDPVFYLIVKALQPTQLSRALQLQHRRLRPEAYTAAGETWPLALHFSAAPKVGHTEVFPAMPNPSGAGPVHVPAVLAEPALVRLDVYDPAGRQLFSQEKEWPAGLQYLEIPASALDGTPGLSMYRVQVEGKVVSGVLVRVK